jgi:hypothetical protein
VFKPFNEVEYIIRESTFDELGLDMFISLKKRKREEETCLNDDDDDDDDALNDKKQKI